DDERRPALLDAEPAAASVDSVHATVDALHPCRSPDAATIAVAGALSHLDPFGPRRVVAVVLDLHLHDVAALQRAHRILLASVQDTRAVVVSNRVVTAVLLPQLDAAAVDRADLAVQRPAADAAQHVAQTAHWRARSGAQDDQPERCDRARLTKALHHRTAPSELRNETPDHRR